MPAALHTSLPVPIDWTEVRPIVVQEIQRDRRLRVLLILNQAPEWLTNESVLKSVLPSMGHAVSSDLLRTELTWLQEQGLINLLQTSDLYVVRLTQRGQDVSRGAAQQPGVALPTDAPGDQ